MPYLKGYKDGGVLLRLSVQPRAAKSRIVGLHDGTVKLGITAAPVDGKANAAVLKFLASFLKVKKKDLEIRYGLHSRNKTVLVVGLDEKTVRRKIEAVL